MPPVLDYKILLEQTPNVLTEKVKEALKDGWQVYGGVTVINNSWAQALVKTEDLLAQILAELKVINTNTKTTATNTTSIVTNTSNTAANTASTAINTANIDRKTPEI